MKKTCCAVLNKLDYPTRAERTEDYLIGYLQTRLAERRVSGKQRGEMQDVGRYANDDTMRRFVKHFRNPIQKSPLPVCLILTSTYEGRELIAFDKTFARCIRPIEILPMTVVTGGLGKSDDVLSDIVLSN